MEPAAGETGPAQTLAGVRVVEIASNIAGPLAAMILGDLGADVVKVEDPAAGDDTRSMPPLVDGTSTVFRAFNRSKRSVAVDLSGDAGRAAVLRLAGTADVVIQNLRPGAADRLGFGFAEVGALNRTVVYCSVSAFGEGPVGRALPGYDAMVQAYAGIMASTGLPGDDTPVRVSAALVDVSTGVWAALGVMAALMRRPRLDGPQYVDPCLIDSALHLMGHQVSAHLGTGAVPERLGSAGPSFVPYQAYRTSDDWIFLAAGTDRLFVRLCDVVGRADLAADDRFVTSARRVEHRHVLDAELAPSFRDASAGSWLERLAAAGVPACPVNHLGEALSSPVVEERRLLVDGGLRLPVDSVRSAPYRPPPGLGEHTEAVLAEAGFSDAEIDRLRRPGPRSRAPAP
ncbi:MAG: CaiB/BaiF CoA transferase family protein [Acidimicrobiia bacterium]